MHIHGKYRPAFYQNFGISGRPARVLQTMLAGAIYLSIPTSCLANAKQYDGVTRANAVALLSCVNIPEKLDTAITAHATLRMASPPLVPTDSNTWLFHTSWYIPLLPGTFILFVPTTSSTSRYIYVHTCTMKCQIIPPLEKVVNIYT
eukprot:SAG11_NODE_14931_length_594_cov_1.812121_1_plen_146_part_10